MKRENAGNWNSGPEIATSDIPILQSSKWPKILQRLFIEYIKNTGEKKYQRGPTSCPQGNRARPPRHALMPCGAHNWPPASSFCYIGSFSLKNGEKTFGTKRRRLEAELGQEQFCSPAERFCQDTSRSHRQHQRSSHSGRTNLHQHLH